MRKNATPAGEYAMSKTRELYEREYREMQEMHKLMQPQEPHNDPAYDSDKKMLQDARYNKNLYDTQKWIREKQANRAQQNGGHAKRHQLAIIKAKSMAW